MQLKGQINNVFPTDPLLQFVQLYSFIFPKVVVKDPLKDAMLTFMDDSPNGRTEYVVNGEGHVV